MVGGQGGGWWVVRIGGWLGWCVVWLGWRVARGGRGVRGVRGVRGAWWAWWWFELRRPALVLSWKMRKSARGEARAALAMK